MNSNNQIEYIKETLSEKERNIIIGSLLGDGSLALYGRSKNAYYREHGCEKQLPYRRWKQEQLSTLGFKLSASGKLSSASEKIYTQLYELFYIDRVKTLNSYNITLLDHPIGLACLFMDDGSLVMDHYSRAHKVQIFPRISLYTLSFSYEENIILRDYLYDRFKISFKLKRRLDGKHYILEINQRNEIYKFISLIQDYVNEIPEMSYKVDLEKSMSDKYNKILLRENGKRKVMTSDLQVESKEYTSDEIERIVQMKESNVPVKIISQELGRSTWGIYDKIRRMKNNL